MCAERRSSRLAWHQISPADGRRPGPGAVVWPRRGARKRSFLTGQRLRGQRPEKMMAVRLVSMMLITVVRASSHWLDAYEQRGYFVLPRVFSGARLMHLRAAVARYLRDHCLLYTSPSPRDKRQSRMPSSA